MSRRNIINRLSRIEDSQRWISDSADDIITKHMNMPYKWIDLDPCYYSATGKASWILWHPFKDMIDELLEDAGCKYAEVVDDIDCVLDWYDEGIGVNSFEGRSLSVHFEQPRNPERVAARLGISVEEYLEDFNKALAYFKPLKRKLQSAYKAMRTTLMNKRKWADKEGYGDDDYDHTTDEWEHSPYDSRSRRRADNRLNRRYDSRRVSSRRSRISDSTESIIDKMVNDFDYWGSEFIGTACGDLCDYMIILIQELVKEKGLTFPCYYKQGAYDTDAMFLHGDWEILCGRDGRLRCGLRHIEIDEVREDEQATAEFLESIKPQLKEAYKKLFDKVKYYIDHFEEEDPIQEMNHSGDWNRYWNKLTEQIKVQRN